MASEKLADPDWLAAAIAAYELDEPHYQPDDSTHYPEIDRMRELLTEGLSRDHCGDCTSQMNPCHRCWAEEMYHKARWILAQATVTLCGRHTP